MSFPNCCPFGSLGEPGSGKLQVTRFATVSFTGSPEDFFVIASTSAFTRSVHASSGTNAAFGGEGAAVFAEEDAVPVDSVFSPELQPVSIRKLERLSDDTMAREEFMSVSFARFAQTSFGVRLLEYQILKCEFGIRVV